MSQPEVAHTGPVTAWSGWDLRRGATAENAAVSLHDHGVVRAYELIAVAARGFRPPRFLRTADLPGVGHGDKAEGDHEGLTLTWSLLYRRVAETGPAVAEPYAIYLLGVNPPADTTESDLAVFNDFYTNVHMPEVVERRRALRAVRYELVQAIRPPYQGAPQFLAAYEVDEAGAANRRHRGPSYAPGPDVWQRHATPWRLWYRRLDIGA